MRLGKDGVWVEVSELRSASKTEQKKLLEDRCDLSATSIKNVLAALTENADNDAAADAIAAHAGKKRQVRNRARLGQLVLQPTATRRSSAISPRNSATVTGRPSSPEAPTASLE